MQPFKRLLNVNFCKLLYFIFYLQIKVENNYNLTIQIRAIIRINVRLWNKYQLNTIMMAIFFILEAYKKRQISGETLLFLHPVTKRS